MCRQRDRFGKSTQVLWALVVALGMIAAALMPNSFAVAADTPAAQRSKVREMIKGKRPPALARMTAGCVRGNVLDLGYEERGGPLVVVVYCPESSETIVALAAKEVRQDTLALGLAAWTAGKPIFILVENGWITAFAAVSGATK